MRLQRAARTLVASTLTRASEAQVAIQGTTALSQAAASVAQGRSQEPRAPGPSEARAAVEVLPRTVAAEEWVVTEA